MAYIKQWYRCPTCQRAYNAINKAEACKRDHPVVVEDWARGRGGKEVRIYPNRKPDSLHGVDWALREADLSDFIEERKKQLENN